MRNSNFQLNLALHAREAGFALLAALMLAGCGNGGGVGGGGTAGQAFRGHLNGGGPQNPIGGSSVKFFAVGQNGYGTTDILLATTTSDSGGSFTFSSYTCPEGNLQSYVVATGGNPGGGTNSAIGLIAMTGPCTSLNASSFVILNELTTVAAEYALAQFTDASGTTIATPNSNSASLDHSANLAMTNLANTADGNPASFLPTAAACTGGSPPANCDALMQMDTIANILAQCVNSTGPSASLPSCASATSACDILFACTSTPSNGTTLQAAHSMAMNPASNVPQIFGAQGSPPTAPFTPYKTSPPPSWTLALNYTGGGLSSPTSVAIDASGNAWAVNSANGTVTELSPTGSGTNFSEGSVNGAGVAIDASGNVWVGNQSNNTISELSSSGTMISPNAGYGGGGLNGPTGIAIDASNNLWAANLNTSSLTKLFGGNTPVSPCPATPMTGDTGCPVPGSPFDSGALNNPIGIAIDAGGNIWAADNMGSDLTEFSSTGTELSPSGGYANRGGLNSPFAVAIDGSGNVWATDQGTTSLVKLCGATTSNCPAGSQTTGAAISPSTGYKNGGLSVPAGVAIDSAGSVWVANAGAASVSEFSSAGSPISGSSGFTGGGASAPSSIALDASGDVWITNSSGGSSLTEFIGAAHPVLTPLVACLRRSTPGTACLP